MQQRGWLGARPVLLVAAFLAAAFAQTDPAALAKRIAEASTDAERSALVAGVTVDEVLLRAVFAEGSSLEKLGRHDRQLEVSRFGLVLAEQTGDPELIRLFTHSIGSILSQQGEYEAAVEWLQKALTLAEELKTPRIASTCIEISIPLRYLGEYQRSIEFARRALAAASQSGNQFEMARAYNSLGLTYAQIDRYADAVEQYEAGLLIAEAQKIREGAAFLTNNIGSIYQLQGDYELAARYFERSLKIKEEIGNRNALDTTLGNLGVVYHAMGRDDLAMERLNRSVALSLASGTKRMAAESLTQIAEIDTKRGRTAAALANLDRALSLSTDPGAMLRRGVVFSGIAAAQLAAGHAAESLIAARTAIELATTREDLQGATAANILAGRASEALGEGTQAREYFVAAVNLIEQRRTFLVGGEREQRVFMEEQASPYRALVRLAVRRGDTEEAFRYAELAKARVLRDALVSSHVAVTKSMTADERVQEQKLRRNIARLTDQGDAARKQLDAARLDYSAMETTLHARHPELRAQRVEMELLTGQAAAAALPPASVLFEYVVDERQIFLLAMNGGRAGGIRMFRIPVSAREMETKVRQFNQLMASHDLRIRDAGRELYRLLIEPAAPMLTGKSAIAIVPDGPLWTLPFQALQPTADKYLIERVSVTYAPSATLLSEIRKRHARTASSTLLAMSYGMADADQETGAIGKLYGPSHSRVLSGELAQEAAFKKEAGRFDVLHLAAHGVLDDSNPLYSYIALGKSSGSEDGRLEAWELMNLDLKANLAVLSACETAKGRVSGGEGMVGLTWALFIAGVPASVASNWKVDSAATANFMIDFHGGLRGGFSPAAALRESALKQLASREFRHPFYWASFSVFGAGF